MKKGWLKPDSWIIKTKLSPPNLPARQIKRCQLLEEFVHSRDCQLVIIHAPAGYGKTTFLKQWFEYHLKNEGTASWLSLDEEEKNPSLFISYLVAALKKAGVPCVSLETIVSQGINDQSARAMTAIIINTLEQFGQELLLFFDDYQLVSCSVINDLVQKLVSRLPENVSIILSSRVYPDLAVQNLRNQGKVRDISISDLRFNPDEVSSVIESELGNVELARLWDRTEGWPIACQMINVLIRNKLFDVRHIDTFSGRTTDLALYITEQVFTSLTGREQQFLMYTAIVNRFTGDLANVLCVDVNCWDILETLVREDLFLIQLDTEGKWYRYHHLFREYLIERLRRDDLEQILHLHLRAAKWFYDNGHVPEAVEHALKGHDLRLAARIVDSLGGWRLIYQDKLDWVMNVLDRLEKAVIDDFPRLFMADLLLLIKRGRPQDAVRRINEMQQKTNGFERWSAEPLEPMIRIELELVKRSILEDYNDEPVSEATLLFALECLKSISNKDYILKALLHDGLSSAYIDAGLLNKASSHIDYATIMYQEVGFYYGAVYICYHRANLNIERAKLHDAGRELLKAKEITSEFLDTNFNLMANTSVYLADIAFMQNRIEEAQYLLDTTLDHIEKHDSWFDLYARAYTTAAGVASINHNFEKASSILERARRTATERNLPRLKLLSDLMEIKLLLLAQQVTRALELANSINLERLADQSPSPNNLSVFIPERAVIVLARVYLMQNKSDKVLELLRPLADILLKQGRLRLLVEVWLLQVRAAYALNDDRDMENIFSKAVDIAMHEKYKRPFVDEGAIIVKIYNHIQNNEPFKFRNRYFRTFLADINRLIHKESCMIDEHINKHGLTNKEYKVIIEMAKGHTNKEIASVLHITEDTVKYRLKQLFKKWNISSREAAIRIARDKSLL